MILSEQKRQFTSRIAVVGFVMCVIALALMGRAVQLNVVKKDFLQGQGDARYLRVVSEPAHRGMITDRHGEPLAISTPVESLWVNPKIVLMSEKSLSALSSVLQTDQRMLQQLLVSRAQREFLYLRRHIAPDLVSRIQKLEIPGVGFQREYRRYYPSGEMAAHVVGFTDVDDNGQEGVELALNDKLEGVPGSKRVIKDRLGRIVENVESVKVPQPGKDVVLSIDRRLQYLAFREIKQAVTEHNAESGSVVVLDAKTGEVLAMANYPAFNPNNREGLDTAFLRNRSVTDVFEPGSTVKPFTIAAGLETGQYSMDSIIETSPGVLRVGGKSIKDHHNLGAIDLKTVIQKSSNVGASKVALSIEPRWLWKIFASVGFGAPSGSFFPGEPMGTLTDYGTWQDIERASLSFGYGLSVTALQLARAYTVFSNDGRLKSMTLLRKLYANDNKNIASIGISRSTLIKVRGMMESVVQTDGTGSKAIVPGYRVAGKTGTVKKLGSEGYLPNSYISVFAGLAPASDPKLVMVVMVDDPQIKGYYGGVVAAPVFSNVMSGALRMLDVQPDDIPTQEQSRRLALLGNSK